MLYLFGMAKVEQEESPLGHVIGRKIYSHLSQLVIPTAIRPEDGGNSVTGVEKARNLLRDDIGLVIIYTHPSRTDTFRLMGLWKYGEYARPRCLIPIAYHQFNLAAKISAWPSGIEFHPIVTRETVARGKNGGLEENHGSVSFLKTAVKLLAGGGIVLSPPTATRTPVLSMPEGTRPTDILLNAAHSKRVSFAVLVTGFEIDGVTSYEKARGFNLLRKYILHTGNTFTADEILEQLDSFRETRGLTIDPKRPFNDTDQWLFETQLPLLVPPAYRPKQI